MNKLFYGLCGMLLLMAMPAFTMGKNDQCCCGECPEKPMPPEIYTNYLEFSYRSPTLSTLPDDGCTGITDVESKIDLTMTVCKHKGVLKSFECQRFVPNVGQGLRESLTVPCPSDLLDKLWAAESKCYENYPASTKNGKTIKPPPDCLCSLRVADYGEGDWWVCQGKVK
jgi:hypothetical protein